MNKLLSVIFCVLPLASARSQEAATAKSPAAAVQPWEYRLISRISWDMELARKFGATEKMGDYEFTNNGKFAEAVRQHPEVVAQFPLDHFNALGAEGWQFSGCIGPDNNTYVFRRPK